MQLISFGGTQLYRPGAYSTVNLRTNSPIETGAFKVLAVVGSAPSGKPATALYYNDPNTADKALGGVDAVLAAKIAWEHGADLICFSLTDTAAQATYAVKDTSATPATLITLGGKRWNATDNQLQVTILAPTNGVQTITLTDTSVTPNQTETYNVTNTAQGWINVVNTINAQSNFVEAVLGTFGVAPAVTTNIGATVAAAAPFAGGSRSASTPTTIAAAIDALRTEDIQGIISPLTDSTSLSAIQLHVTAMSNVQSRRERRAFIGQPLGTTYTQYVSAMAGFVSSRMTVCAPGHYKAVNGGKTLLSSAFTAAAVAGLWAGKANPNDPVTSDFMNALGLEYVWTDEIRTLVQAQVTVVEAIPRQGYQIVQALTGDPNLYELSVADLIDIMSRSMRDLLQSTFVGKAGYNGIVGDMVQLIQTQLESYKSQNWLVDSTDMFNQPLPAYRNISVVKMGSRYSVSYEMKPSEPTNYITITELVNVS
jgi:hypothetical protein